MIYWLDQEFNRYYVTIGHIKLEKILIYDNNFKLITSSDRGIDINSKDNLPCAQTINYVSSLPNIQRTKPKSELCEYNNQPLLTVVISIGSIRSKGYIQIITSPAHMLTQIETELGLPLKIYSNKNELLHQSVNWPAKSDTQKHLVSTYLITDTQDNVSIKISGASDITAFKNHLDNTRYKVILGATALTLFTLLFAFVILQRGLLPLKNLRRAADSSARGEFASVE